MPSFESVLSSSGLTFGPDPVPHTPRPGLHPGQFDDFRHSPSLRNSLSGTPPDEVYAQWAERAKYVAEKAELVANSNGRSSAALARLAHAYLAADKPELAIEVAVEALESISNGTNDPAPSRLGQSVDVSAAVAAAWALVVSGHANEAKVHLANLPLSVPIAILRASIAIDDAELSDALQLIANFDGPDVSGMRAYILLKLNRPQEAIREVRKATLAGSTDADTRSTMAAAFWRLGSRRKAINYAQQASKLAPGRKDISFALIDYLTNAFKLDAADAEIRKVLDLGVEDEPELIVRRARIRLLLGDTRRCIALLRRAESMARASDDTETLCFTRGQLALVEYNARMIDRAEALRRIRKLMSECPENISLAYVFSSLCIRTSMTSELKQVYKVHENSASREQLRPLAVTIAYLEGRYEDLARLVREWSSGEPLNSVVANLAMMWTAYTSLDWSGAARSGALLLQRFPYDVSLANNVAYLSVLAGRPWLADKALEAVGSKDTDKPYVLLATRGLIQIAKGDLRSGLKAYRLAAEMAEKDADGQVERAGVIVAQAMALRIIGALGEVSDLLRAGMLPGVSLPANWRDVPELRMEEWLSKRLGLPWPPFVS